MLIALALLTLVHALSPAAAPAMTDLIETQSPSHIRIETIEDGGRSDPDSVFLWRARGRLRIAECTATAPYIAYFHIPIAFQEQAPIDVRLTSVYLIDYRFLRLSGPNVVVAARLEPASDITIKWNAYVFVQQNDFADIPTSAPIPAPEELPDSVSQWLAATDCIQVEDSLVQHVADSLRQGTTDLIELATRIGGYCADIPYQLIHEPYGFDAVYALKYGNTCTGQAHAGAALFRANGIPARSLMNLPGPLSSEIDMHWIIDFFVPGYGWVRMETGSGEYPLSAQRHVVFMRCDTEDEFCTVHPYGIEGIWHTSDRDVSGPEWWLAHQTFGPLSVTAAPADSIRYARALTDSVFRDYVECWGIGLPPAQQAWLDQAYGHQGAALDSLWTSRFQSFVAEMEAALAAYRNVSPEPVQTVYFSDFEGGAGGWVHGGPGDEWEWGSPSYGPEGAYSGASCWGTDLDGTYPNLADSWLESPPVDLSGLGCAYLSFLLWNWVEDRHPDEYMDPLWLEISEDGSAFRPLCDEMGGVNDDPEIPDVGGWNQVVLDLTPHVGHTVVVRYRFSSDSTNAQAGSYIDDVHIYGRLYAPTGIAEGAPAPNGGAFLFNAPNPFNPSTTIRCTLPGDGRAHLSVHDVSGRLVRVLMDDCLPAGRYFFVWDGRTDAGGQAASGTYCARLRTNNGVVTRKLLLIR